MVWEKHFIITYTGKDKVQCMSSIKQMTDHLVEQLKVKIGMRPQTLRWLRRSRKAMKPRFLDCIIA